MSPRCGGVQDRRPRSRSIPFLHPFTPSGAAVRKSHVPLIAMLISAAPLMLAAAPAHCGSGAKLPSYARQSLPAHDGWASQGAGTTGGAAADAAHTVTVTNRAELAAALDHASSTPKIIQISGVIDGNTDDAGAPLSCEDYATGGYSLDAYLAAYDPSVWGTEQVPAGALEDVIE